jgi:hypothetical protein
MAKFVNRYFWVVNRSPHVTITFYDDVESVARLLAVTHRTVSNPAHRQEEP